MTLKVGDRVKVLVGYMTPAQVGDTATVTRVTPDERWPVVGTVEGRENIGEFYFAESEVELIQPEVSQLDRIEAKLDRLLLRVIGEKYENGRFVK